MKSKNKRIATSSLDNISTSCEIGNNHVDYDIDFNMVEPVDDLKDMFQSSFIIHQNSVLT